LFLIQPRPDVEAFNVTCNFTSPTVITKVGHNSEEEMVVDGFEPARSYVRDVVYDAPMTSILALMSASSKCRQFIKYMCHHSLMFRDQTSAWRSRDGKVMTHWGGAKRDKHCSCGEKGTCAHSRYKCNCDINDYEWREDYGYLTDRTTLPVTQLMFGDTGSVNNPKVETIFHEQGFHTLGKLECY